MRDHPGPPAALWQRQHCVHPAASLSPVLAAAELLAELCVIIVQARAEEAMKRSAGAAHLEWLEPESDEGNVEYKLRLKDPSTMRFQQLVTQMKFRLSEGNGECFYYLGEPGASAASASCPLQLRSVAVYDFVELGIVAAGSNRLTLSCNMAANAHILKPPMTSLHEGADSCAQAWRTTASRAA